jgi:hypothetical protein
MVLNGFSSTLLGDFLRSRSLPRSGPRFSMVCSFACWLQQDASKWSQEAFTLLHEERFVVLLWAAKILPRYEDRLMLRGILLVILIRCFELSLRRDMVVNWVLFVAFQWPAFHFLWAARSCWWNNVNESWSWKNRKRKIGKSVKSVPLKTWQDSHLPGRTYRLSILAHGRFFSSKSIATEQQPVRMHIKLRTKTKTWSSSFGWPTQFLFWLFKG